MRKLLLLFGILLILPLVNATQIISPNHFSNYKLDSITGNESKYYDVIFDGSTLTAIKKFPTTQIVQECVLYNTSINMFSLDGKDNCLVYKNITYTQPSTLKYSDSLGNIITLPFPINSVSYKIPSNLFTTKTFLKWIKFGLQTITIKGDTAYTSNTSTNVTTEATFAHLNISTTAPYDTLVGYWSFDVNGSNPATNKTYDYSQYNNDGTINGSVWNNSAGATPYGNAYEFDGNDYINLGTNILTDNVTTESIWVKSAHPLANGQYEIVTDLQRTTDLVMYIYNSSGTRINFGHRTALANDGVTCLIDYGADFRNKWNHITAIYNGGSVSAVSSYNIYVNGINCSVVTYNFGGSTSSNILGFDSDIPGGYYNGSIDEFMVFNSSLTAQQVLDIYNNQSARFSNKGNISFWNLDSGLNQTLNISIPINQTYLGSLINGSINGETEFPIINGVANVINITNAGEFNLTLILYAGNNTQPFYSPVFGGNITIESFVYASGGDTVSPILNITYPVSNDTLHTTNLVQINYTVSDETALSICWYTNSSGQFNYTITCGANLTTLNWDEGVNTVRIYANDTSNNVNSSSVNFSIDSIIPLINFSTHTEDDGANISAVSIFANVTLTETNFKNITFILRNDTGIVNETTFTTQVLSINFTSNISLGNYTYNVSTYDTFGNFNSTETRSINLTNITSIDLIPPNVTIIDPPDGSEDSDGIVTFTYNVTELNTVSNCSLYLDGVLKETDTSITKSVIQSFTINPPIKSQLLWSIGCVDGSSNSFQPTNFSLKTIIGASNPAGGGGGGGAFDKPLRNSVLCNYTYDFANDNIETLPFVSIVQTDILRQQINEETNLFFDSAEIWSYVNNWQSYCSDLVKKTLKEDLVCEKSFYLITQTNYSYDYQEINDLRNDLLPDLEITPELLKYYADNYDSVCSQYKELPIKKKAFSISEITPDFFECSPIFNNTFFDSKISTKGIIKNFQLAFNGNEEEVCNKIDFWRWIFALEKISDNQYQIVGIKLWYFFVFALIGLGVLIYRSGKKSK